MGMFRDYLERTKLEEIENSDNRKFISFQNFFVKEDETNLIKESVINKIKELYLMKDADKLVKKFKEIFEITNEIKIKKVEIGGEFNPTTLEISYSSMNSLIHELVHYLQVFYKHKAEYYYVDKDKGDCSILKYMLQPLELNNWAISLAAEALEYNSFDEFLKIAKISNDFWSAKSKERLSHILYLLTNNMGCSIRKSDKEKLLKKSKQYYLVVKSLKKDIREHYVESFSLPGLF